MNKSLLKKFFSPSKIIIKRKDEIEKIRIANKIVAEILQYLKENTKAGMSTLDIEKLTEEKLKKYNVISAFKGYRNYPSLLCISVNDEVVHGIPSKDKILKSGDLVSLDVGVIYNDYVGDAAISFIIEDTQDEIAKKLIKTTEEALYNGINECKPRARLHNISAAIQETAEREGFSVVRDFVGHGVGRYLHEPPAVPNYGKRGQGPLLMPGMIIAIEPMINAGSSEVMILNDGWTAVTKDGSLSAHFEHSVLITEKEPEILSKL